MSLYELVLKLFFATVELLISDDKCVPALKWIFAFYKIMDHLVKILLGSPFRPKSQ